ncbi:glycosyl hydrolase [Pedobacter sp. Du54]|uniref:glycosyl hydrolase n=1 Tax=Pedobacter anseongensis TaxID=3133439 RepID=UPI0030B01EC8
MKVTKVLLLLTLSFCFARISYAQQADSAKPWVFWYWVQAGISKAGITADLEAMKENGIGGAYLMTIKGEKSSNPPLYQPASNQLTPQWWDMVKFAFSEAKRLDLKLGMHISDGFALAGGPWITPALSMQKVVSSKLTLKGGIKGKITLPQPETKEGYYKDIAVYAYPSPVGAHSNTQTVIPKITTSNGADAGRLIKADNTQSFSSSDPLWIQYEFAKPFTCRSINIKTSGNNYQSNRLILEVSEDGSTFRKVTQLEAPRHGWQDTDEDFTHAIVPTTAKFFRFQYNKAGSEPGSEDLDAAKWKQSLKIITLELSAEAKIGHYEGKNGSIWRVSRRTTRKEVPNNLAIPLKKMINLTKLLHTNGTLDWTPPSGEWTILRVGHTSTGQRNATGGAAIGLECDKFNPQAISLQFNSWFGEALKQGGPEIAAKVLNTFHVDSWECGSQNWSPVFKAEFLKRRGYDLLPYLPIMTGLPVQSIETSENFLYDVRKTIAELVVDQFYGTLAKLAKEKGVEFTAESVAPTMLSDGLMHYKKVNIPMGEFWLNSPTHDKPNDMLDAISGAHIYGKNSIQAEAFTTLRMDWNEHPGNMKTLMDRNFALGINKMVFHVFTHNPWVDQKPGMTLDGVGLYFQRDQTWWKQGKAWVDYAERAQSLLQEGKPVVDIAVFTGEELPRRSILPDRLVPILPGIFGSAVVEAEAKRLANIGEPLRSKPAGVNHSANMADPENWVNPLNGYAYDSFNPDVLTTATVKNKEIVFESGATYKILIISGKLSLNPNYQYLSYETVKKLLDLVKAGASIIVAEQPLYQTGLKQKSKEEFDQVVNQIWGENFKTVKNRKLETYVVKEIGLGKVYKAPFIPSDFSELGLSRDLMAHRKSNVQGSPPTYAEGIAFTHRKANDKDIYFIANQQDKERYVEFEFRIDNKIPVLYDAVYDRYMNVISHKNGSLTSLTLKFAPHESVFVIFQDDIVLTDKIRKQNWINFKTLTDLSTNWEVKFDPAFGGPKEPLQFNTLVDWTKHADTTLNYYSGTAIYSKTFLLDEAPKQKTWINLGNFSSIAEVKVNGVSYGVLWTPPFQLEISKALTKGENKITVAITNTWANRLIGDQKLPENKRLTKTTAPFRLAGKPLNPAGLFGPITLEIEEK